MMALTEKWLFVLQGYKINLNKKPTEGSTTLTIPGNFNITLTMKVKYEVIVLKKID